VAQVIYVYKDADGKVTGVQPEMSFEIGKDEAWTVNLKDNVETHFTDRVRNRNLTEKLEEALYQQYLSHREEMFDARRRHVEDAHTIIMHNFERMGTKQDVAAENMWLDPTKQASEAIGAAMAQEVQKAVTPALEAMAVSIAGKIAEMLLASKEK